MASQNGFEWISWLQKKIAFFLLLLLMLSTIFLLSVWYSSHSLTFTAKETLSKQNLRPQEPYDGAASSDLLDGDSSFTIDESCDISIGKWVRETRGPVYSNLTCSFIPEMNNCQKYGKPPGYLYWRWKPDGCDLPWFEPQRFLDLVRGKKLAFIGDSIARNQFESLLCLLSQVDTAIQIEGNSTRKYRTIHFQSSNFTLMVMWSEYYVKAVPNTNCDAIGCFDLYLDKVNLNWTSRLPGLDYLVISGGNWYFRKNYLYENDTLIGCTNCNEEKLKDYGTVYAIRSALRKALESINSCQSCRRLKTFVRTYSTAHFENGAWFNGGNCNRTEPFNESEINLYGYQSEVAKVQNEEVERIKGSNVVDDDNKNYFGVLDVTEAMMRRGDGHPGGYYNKHSKTANDCLHWCLPGPVDMWNEMLMHNLIKTSSLG
ncbi:Protein trichome birefringence [Rhynchospora pubera]|uniref:Protein trichome birefringence n=1 Tax=Rhynchospora pubera TaxID=906938 RepID=A0AAV8H8M5_9POAL|nr:Protein trichome birefringence [Rhynchospora pubera]